MLQINVGYAENGKRLDRFLFSVFPDIPGAAFFKAFKKKDVKVNGKRAREDILVAEGDVVLVYLPSESIPGRERPDAGNGSDERERPGADNKPDEREQPGANSAPTGREREGSRNAEGVRRGRSPVLPADFKPEIAYEDDALLIVVKPQGVLVQEAMPDSVSGQGMASQVDTGFDDAVRAWWSETRSGLPDGFPTLCHRLDRNTGGLLMFAKSTEALQAVTQKLKSHQIRKHYQCLVAGTPAPPVAEVKAWLEKDASKGRAYIHETPKANAVPICTRYRTLSSDGSISRLEVEIITGRTHQIRAQLARLGHPILGDSKYGSNAVNRRHHIHRQALWSCRLDFLFPAAGPLSCVAGRTVECTDIPWEVEIGTESHD